MRNGWVRNQLAPMTEPVLLVVLLRKKADETAPIVASPPGAPNTELISFGIDFCGVLWGALARMATRWAELQRNRARAQERATVHSPDK